jgi:hypothetical protein
MMKLKMKKKSPQTKMKDRTLQVLSLSLFQRKILTQYRDK